MDLEYPVTEFKPCTALAVYVDLKAVPTTAQPLVLFCNSLCTVPLLYSGSLLLLQQPFALLPSPIIRL